MIKNFSINKIVVTSVSLFLLLLFYFFPSDNNLDIALEVTHETKGEKEVVYLMDIDGYISKLETYISSLNLEDEIYKKINILIEGDETLKNFIPLIPKGTKINSIKIENDKVTIDFSKEILNVTKNNEEKMLEAIIFTLTQTDEINEIYLKVDGKLFNELPNSKKIINYPLTRNYGINKEYDITNLNNITKTTVYFVKENEDFNYYVPVTKISNTSSEKIDIIIKELKSSVNYQSNLNSYLSNNLNLDDYEITKDAINLIFNEYIFDDISEEKILEEVKYTISQSILENYKVKEVIFSTKEKNNIETVSKLY
ncbi:MAG: GerMN domain-containing protein [Bacilli bacterium]|nr:GerMN domain-containing protein [Bacilli bacterium]